MCSARWCIIAVCRNEGTNIVDWIEYHQRLGLSHLYIYLDRCTDDTLKKLQPFCETGFATVTQINFLAFEKGFPQIYTKAIDDVRSAGGGYDWAAFLDIDEYIRCINPEEKLGAIFDEFSDFGGIVVNWRMFTSSMHHSLDADKDVRNSFLFRQNDDWCENKFVKSFVNLNKFKGRFTCGHLAVCDDPDAPVIYTDRRHANYSKNDFSVMDRLVIHHYHIRSAQYFATIKMARSSDNSFFDYGFSRWLDSSKRASNLLFDNSISDGHGVPIRVLENHDNQPYDIVLKDWVSRGCPDSDISKKEHRIYSSVELEAFVLSVYGVDHFDAKFYLMEYEDLAQADVDPIEHYLVFGRYENRRAFAKSDIGRFDHEFYMKMYPDVLGDPLDHYYNHGQFENRIPYAK